MNMNQTDEMNDMNDMNQTDEMNDMNEHESNG